LKVDNAAETEKVETRRRA